MVSAVQGPKSAPALACFSNSVGAHRQGQCSLLAHDSLSSGLNQSQHPVLLENPLDLTWRDPGHV